MDNNIIGEYTKEEEEEEEREKKRRRRKRKKEESCCCYLGSCSSCRFNINHIIYSR